LEAFALVFRQRTYKDWGFHGAYCNPSTKTYPEDALGRLKTRLLRRQATRSTLLSPEELRRSVPASGAMYRGRRTLEVSKIVGSVGKHEQFDMNFMPLSGASSEKWKRIDRAFRLGQELPPVSLLELGGAYFVMDGNHRVSVARFQGVEWIDAEVTESKSLRTRTA
jgi:hypothetical protein